MSEMDRRGWHIDKGIPIAVLVTVVLLAVSIARDQSKQDERLSLVESSVQTLQQARINDQERTQKTYDELRVDIRRMNEKLDRLLESQYGRN
ncbi:hypothetical protein ABWH88_06755 [Marinobacter adhaerens]|jgi:type II secretory pathway pseudopilin PulG|uniref:hypothetical protein n=2 Tax=Marinobacter adhaerens TaxID=1033846 RepID=UPI001D4AFA00|nr:hypothetical protein [Marinobacter adhaerens]